MMSVIWAGQVVLTNAACCIFFAFLPDNSPYRKYGIPVILLILGLNLMTFGFFYK